ncbi:MAG: hypothetical protein AAB355_00350, partial [Patescibacteria group bacterium]
MEISPPVIVKRIKYATIVVIGGLFLFAPSFLFRETVLPGGHDKGGRAFADVPVPIESPGFGDGDSGEGGGAGDGGEGGGGGGGEGG